MPIYKQNQKNKDGVYKYKVRVNYVDGYGNKRQLTRVAYGLQEAKKLERALSIQTEEKTITKSITVNDLHKEYCDNMSHELRKSSIFSKEKNYKNYISEYLGKKKISDLSVRVLTHWKNKLNKRDISTTTKKNAYSELKATMNYAVHMEYIAINPLNKITTFKDAYEEEKNINFYTPEEFKKFKASALKIATETGCYDFYVFFAIAYYTGCRKGEIHALRWSSIEDDYLKITKSISQKLKGGDVETPPKNKSSVRTIQIPTPLLNILKEHKERQQKAVKSINQKWSDDAFICGYNRPLRDSTIENMNKKIAEDAGIKKIRIHDFRHSHASLLINSGINALEVARRLGHSTVEQTLQTYSHLFPKESEKAISILNVIE